MMDVILRRRAVEQVSGLSRSSIYSQMTSGLWPRGVNIGPRTVGWPEGEVAAVLNARISGATNEQVKALVAALHARRAQAKEASAR